MGYQVANVDEDRYLIVNSLIALPLRPMKFVRRGTIRKENSFEEISLLLPDVSWWSSIGLLTKDDTNVLYSMMKSWPSREEPHSIIGEFKELNGQ